MQVTQLAIGTINGADELRVELSEPDDMPAAVRIIWPPKPTVWYPRRYAEVAAAAMKLLAEASQHWPGSKRAGGCNPG